jgi:hypothetical protein
MSCRSAPGRCEADVARPYGPDLCPPTPERPCLRPTRSAADPCGRPTVRRTAPVCRWPLRRQRSAVPSSGRPPAQGIGRVRRARCERGRRGRARARWPRRSRRPAAGRADGCTVTSAPSGVSSSRYRSTAAPAASISVRSPLPVTGDTSRTFSEIAMASASGLTDRATHSRHS